MKMIVKKWFKTLRKETSTHLNQRAIPKTTGFVTSIPTSILYSRMPYTRATIGFGLQWVAEEFTMSSLLSALQGNLTHCPPISKERRRHLQKLRSGRAHSTPTDTEGCS